MKRLIYFLFVIFLLCLSLNVYADSTYVLGKIASGITDVSFRSCASSSCAIIIDDDGDKIFISYPTSFEIIGEENNYYKIKLQYNAYTYTGYVAAGPSSSYVDKSTYTILDSTITELQNLGFNYSYASKLAVLKTIHPNWNFKILNTGLNWSDVMYEESRYVNKNLIDGNNISLRSTADGAYSNGVYATFSGGNWYAASAQTISFFMDPRNFFNNNRIFMFESLSFDKDIQTEPVLQTLLNPTFMAGNAFYYDANSLQTSITYSRTFVDAGSTNNISSVHLVGRVIQEQGSNGSVLSSGTYPGHVGYYNFFNINAKGTTEEDVITNGFAYAEKKGWNSPYKSIVEGASFLVGDYISKGQSTLYSQKFDIIGPYYYTNQYMQNVRAPYQESYSSYKAYLKNNLLDSSFTFVIPYYNAMPEATSLDVTQNGDSTLKALTVSGCNLMPSFTSSAYNYTCNVDKGVSKVTINATATTIYSSVTGTGDINLPSDTNIVTIKVTAANATTSQYTITINKVSSDEYTPDEILAKLQINNDANNLSGFDLNSDVNSLINLIKTNYASATITSSATGKLFTGMTIDLSNNNKSSAYKIIIYGDNSGDGLIDIVDLLRVQKHLVGARKLDGAYLKASDVNKDGTVDIVDLLKIQKHILNVKQIDQ